MKIHSIILALFIVCTIKCSAQTTITIVDSTHKTSLRGLSIVNNNIVWASGSNGSVAKSVDLGKTIKIITNAGYEKRDFRDIEAFDANVAIIMAVAEPAVILKTKDGGKNWYKVFEDSTKGMFLDAMDFNDEKHGTVVGDPINGKPFIAFTNDAGEHWSTVKASTEPIDLIKNEAFFAASGTNIKYTNYNQWSPIILVSGGYNSSLITIPFTIKKLPIIQGKETTGANSIDIDNNSQKAIVVGGDFANDKDATQNCVLIDLKNNFAFSHPQTPPNGYRSCVIYINEKQLVTCGTSGVDISNDGGMNWQLISTESFNVVQKAKIGNAIFLAGNKGKIARLTLQ
jgi:hypothetical protein